MDYSQLIYDTAIGDAMPPSVANLIVAQAKHESANFTSGVFKADNNFFGYKFVGQKIATKGRKSPEGNHYAHYKTPADSIHEITAWIKRRVKQKIFPEDLSMVTEPAQYANLLKKAGYYGDDPKHYIAGLTHYYHDYS